MDSTFYFQWQYLITHINNLHYEKFQDGTVKCIEDEIPFEVPEGWCWCRLPCYYNMTFSLAETNLMFMKHV